MGGQNKVKDSASAFEPNKKGEYNANPSQAAPAVFYYA